MAQQIIPGFKGAPNITVRVVDSSKMDQQASRIATDFFSGSDQRQSSAFRPVGETTLQAISNEDKSRVFVVAEERKRTTSSAQFEPSTLPNVSFQGKRAKAAEPKKVSLVCTEEFDSRAENEVEPSRKEIFPEQLEELERIAWAHGDLWNAIDTIKAFQTLINGKIEEIDFSIGYDQGERFQADLREMGSLFQTFVTIQGVFDRKCENLRYDGKHPRIANHFQPWFNAVMGNLVIRILREVASNNRDARQGQINDIYRQLKEPNADITHLIVVRDYALDRKGELDEDSYPDSWKNAAIAELEKFFAFEDRIMSDHELKMESVLREALSLLKRYS